MNNVIIKVKIRQGEEAPMIYTFDGDDSIKQMIRYFKKKYGYDGDIS